MNVTENFSIGPFVLAGAPRALRFEGQEVELPDVALDVLAAIAHDIDGVAAAQLWPLVSAELAYDEDRLCELVGDINVALGRWSPAWYVAWYPEDAEPRFALVDSSRRPQPKTAPPAPRTDVIGREDAIARVVSQLASHRFVTILATGGMGKTTVALAAVHAAADNYPDGVHVVDLAPIVDPRLVAHRVASAVGCIAAGADALSVLQRWVRDQRALVMLDSCEHVVEAASSVAETLVGTGRMCAVLATSREPLRAAGEWLHRLAPMQLPLAGAIVSAREAVDFSALRLFVERAAAANPGFELRDADVPLVTALCARLDGIPLAIEIVAARVGTLGLAGLASQLESRLLRMPGDRRSAPERHKTLASLLDWSFQLLTPAEQQVLRRLSVFRGGFAIDTAIDVVADDVIGDDDVQDVLLDLIAKSLVAPVRRGEIERLRLLDTTRAYAATKLENAGERDLVGRRHARWLAKALAEAERAWNRMARPRWVEHHAPLIDDLRAALDWAFGPGGDLDLGVDLTIAGFALGREMVLIDEFTHRAERAVKALEARGVAIEAGEADAVQNSRRMRLNYLIGCLGTGGGPALLDLAPELVSAATTPTDTSDLVHRFTALNSMWSLSVWRGDFHTASTWATRLEALGTSTGDAVARHVASRIQAQTLHFVGRHADASEHAHRVLGEAWRTIPLIYNPSPVAPRVSMRVVLARVLWMQGFPERAAAMARDAMEHARTDSPISLCQAICMGAFMVAMWSGDHVWSAELSAALDDIEGQLGFDHWRRWIRRFRDVVVLQSDAAPAAAAAAAEPGFFIEAETLLSDQLATLDDRWLSAACVARVESGAVGWCAPEVLRRLGMRALGDSSPDGAARGEALLLRSLALARQHQAASWELRAATSLASHWRARGRVHEAGALLEPIFSGFTEGFATTDLRAASVLLETL